MANAQKVMGEESKFLKVEEVCAILKCSEPHAYKVMKQLNDELKKKGMIVTSGRISRKYFEEKVYM